jgi:hypothetical protein
MTTELSSLPIIQIPCTGQRPNSAILQTIAPCAICPTTKQILIQPTMQIQDSNPNTRIFAIGDVAKTGGPRMARAAPAQADVVTLNILSIINQQKPSTSYSPQIYVSVIKLTLGKVRPPLPCPRPRPARACFETEPPLLSRVTTSTMAKTKTAKRSSMLERTRAMTQHRPSVGKSQCSTASRPYGRSSNAIAGIELVRNLSIRVSWLRYDGSGFHVHCDGHA